jgi:hypothetical protein
VAWNQQQTPGGEEPEHPAPKITLTPAAAGSGGHGGDHGQATTTGDEAGTDTTARWLGGIGLALGAIGLVLGAGAFLRARNNTPRGTTPAGDGEKVTTQ